ncbi:MAG: hypothetical protein ABI867_35720 [Kofleriaceae bacterium]
MPKPTKQKPTKQQPTKQKPTKQKPTKPKKAPTLDRAILDVLARKGRVVGAFKLTSYTMHALGKVMDKVPSATAIGAVIKWLVEMGKIVEEPTGKKTAYLVTAKARVKARPKRKPAAALPRERVLFASAREDAFATARAVIANKFTVVSKTTKSIAFRWHGPKVTLAESDLATMRRYMYPWQKRELTATGPTTCLVLEIDDLEEALDEINTLIEAQSVISAALAGPYFLAWNKKLMKADGRELHWRYSQD